MQDFIMERTAIHVNVLCNLRCKLCSNYLPYYPPHDYPIAKLEESANRYFRIVTYVKKLTIAGGEPLLYPELASFIKHLQKSEDQIGTIEVITNGTTIPNCEVLDAATYFKDKIYFLIDNYGTGLSAKVDMLDHLLGEKGIRHVVRDNAENNSHCGGWVNYGDLTRKKHNTLAEMEELYGKCAHPQKLKFCFGMADGVMYPCTPYRRCKELGLIDDYSEYIDLFDDTLSIEDQRQKIKNIYNGRSLSACAYCNGLCDDSPRFVPAQQLSAEEQACIRSGARIYAEVQRMMER